MKFDVFSEAQRVGPRDEPGLFRDLLEQARLADALGLSTWWLVEHHGAGEYSYSSAPELLLAWIASETDRLRACSRPSGSITRSAAPSGPRCSTT